MAAAANIQALANASQTAVQQVIQQNKPQCEVIFSATPGHTNPDQPIDYTSRIGNDLWKQATTSLPHKFDVESSQIHQFIEDLRDRAVASGWSAGQGNIVDIPDSGGTSRNLIKQYGQLSRQSVQEHVAGYLGQSNSQRSQNANV